MAEKTPNEDLASSVSVDGETKDATQAYDRKAGSYAPQHTQGQEKLAGQPSSPVQPFSNVRGPK